MDLHYRTIFKITGLVLMITACAMLLPFFTAICYGETASREAFFETLLACWLIGIPMYKLIKPTPGRLRLRDGFLIVAFCWMLISAIAAIPMVKDGSIPNYIDSFFEMCSGFTTTGATAISDVEALPRAVLMWRAVSHWIGGMGILVLAIALLPALGISGQEIAEAETPGPVLAKITPRMNEMARDLYLIYMIFTVAETVLLMLGGLSFFDALTHSFSTVGTGGFSNYNDSIAHFDSHYVNIVIGIFMIACGINFNMFYALFRERKARILKDQECRLYGIFFVLFSCTTALSLLVTKTDNGIVDAFGHAMFQVASIITTTGFATTDFAVWPSIAVMLLFCVFFIGGCSSSTAGGVKVIRILIMLKMIRRSISLKLHPNALSRIRYNGRTLGSDVVQGICAFVFLYIATFFIVSIMISLDDFDMFTNASAVATCLGNIGPGFGAVGPLDNFGIYSTGAKFILSMTMIAGRLELFTLLMLFTEKFWNPNE